MTDISFFKKELAPLLESFNLEYRNYPEGDLGSLEQVVFNTPKFGGNFDFWESGWLGVFIYDYVADSIIYNNLFAPQELHQDSLKKIVDKILRL